MIFCCLSCVRLLPRFVFSESLPGRFARFLPNSALGSGFESLCAENFLHKLFGMLNAWLRPLWWSHARHALSVLSAIAQKVKRIEKLYFMGIFERSEKSRARRCAIVLCNMSRVLRALLRSHAVVSAQARTCLMLQKHWFFYHAVVIPMQCSRSPRARTTSPLTHG